MKPIRLVVLAFLLLPAAPAALAQLSSAAPMKVTPTLTPLPVKAPQPVITAPRPQPAPIVALPMTPKPVVAPIERKPVLVKMPEKPAYALRPEAGQVKFGDGEHGRRPPSGRKPVAAYRRGAGPMLPAVQKPGKLAPQGPIMLSPLDAPRRTRKEEGGADGSERQMKLQNTMQESNELSKISNVMKSSSDTNKAIIDNLK